MTCACSTIWRLFGRPNNNGTSAKLSGPVKDRINEYFDISTFSQAATNHPTWASPGTTVNASSGFGQITSASTQRVMQLALKLSF